MSLSVSVRRFYQTNLANGEFRKHKGGYLAAGLLGYLLLHAMCGCAPAHSALGPGARGVGTSLELRVWEDALALRNSFVSMVPASYTDSYISKR